MKESFLATLALAQMLLYCAAANREQRTQSMWKEGIGWHFCLGLCPQSTHSILHRIHTQTPKLYQNWQKMLFFLFAKCHWAFGAFLFYLALLCCLKIFIKELPVFLPCFLCRLCLCPSILFAYSFHPGAFPRSAIRPTAIAGWHSHCWHFSIMAQDENSLW
jgi:hypothetical protein